MRFSILHLSDLHRDLSDEVDNASLLDSFERDFEQQARQEPAIPSPAICIVTGDLIYGVSPTSSNPDLELGRQYGQTLELIVAIADRFLDGKRENVVILPGNHDVAYNEVVASLVSVEMPTEADARRALKDELFWPRSALRWQWSEFAMYRIGDKSRYEQRFRYFAHMYGQFYEGRRTFPMSYEDQYAIFDFPSLGFCVLALNSCYENDPLHRAGAFHPTALTRACSAIKAGARQGWLIAAAWHHSFRGGPAKDDYLDAEFLQLLIQAGASLGFHGHQHVSDCLDERYRVGSGARKMTIVSAGTLCAGPNALTPGEARGFNVVELDTTEWTGRIHQRTMTNQLFAMPIWGPGHIAVSNASYLDFDLCRPIEPRPSTLDTQLTLTEADKRVGNGQWAEAIALLDPLRDEALARPLLSRALSRLGDPQRTLDVLWPPSTPSEAVLLGGAILELHNSDLARQFENLPFVMSSSDPSVREVLRRIAERHPT